jgi:hypothetical protein
LFYQQDLESSNIFYLGLPKIEIPSKIGKGQFIQIEGLGHIDIVLAHAQEKGIDNCLMALPAGAKLHKNPILLTFKFLLLILSNNYYNGP